MVVGTIFCTSGCNPSFGRPRSFGFKWHLVIRMCAEALRLAIDAELAPLDGTAGPGKAPDSATSEGVQDDPPVVPEQPDGEMLPSVLDVLEGTTDCVFLLDDDWRFTYLNQNAAKMIGSRSDLRGKVIWEAFPLSVGTRAWEHRRADCFSHRAGPEKTPFRWLDDPCGRGDLGAKRRGEGKLRSRHWPLRQPPAGPPPRGKLGEDYLDSPSEPH
jgi:PAS domain-containing protein